MSRIIERIFLRKVRLSFPALHEPRAAMLGINEDPKYQATFLFAPNSENAKIVTDALYKVAVAEWGQQKAAAVVKSPDKIPLKSGDLKEKIPDGYAGMLYIAARSKNAPELRDANRQLITDRRIILDRFVPGYYVNAFIDLYPYHVKAPNGADIKTGIGCGLVAVQFAAYADAFGATMPGENEFPDCTAEAEASSAFKPVDLSPENTAPAPAYTNNNGAPVPPYLDNNGAPFDVPF